MLATNFGNLSPKMTNFGSPNFGTDNGSFEYFNCMHRYITMVCNLGDIHAPQNLLLCLKSNQRSISYKGSQTLETETQTEKITEIPPHGNTSPTS